MKRSYFILSVAVAALFAGACTNEIEDVFPQTAAQRLNEAEQECLDLLLSSENGWFIQYYPSSGREYGGFSFSARFDDEGNVTMTSELAADPAVTATSHYSINTSTSVTLTFDTYNSYFHSLSDPDIYGTNALGGDFEFAFESGDESRIVFRAIKTGNRIVFTALDDNTDVVAAISNVLDMKNDNITAILPGGSTDKDLTILKRSSYLDYNGQVEGTVSVTGATLNKSNQINGRVLSDGSVVNEDGQLSGELIDGDIVINNEDKFVGYVMLDGSVKSKDGAKIGRLLSKELAIDDKNNILGRVFKIGATVLNNKGEYIGRVTSEGKVLNKKGENIGYIKNNGSYIDLDKKVSGYVLQEVAKNRRN